RRQCADGRVSLNCALTQRERSQEDISTGQDVAAGRTQSVPGRTRRPVAPVRSEQASIGTADAEKSAAERRNSCGAERLADPGGRIDGFCGNITRFTGERLTVILLTNLDHLTADPIAAHVGALIIGTPESDKRHGERERRTPVRRPSARPAAGRDR